MYTLAQNTTLVGVSELRSKWSRIVEAMKNSRVLVARRNAPEAVLIPIKQFEEMENTLDRLEDYALAFRAHEREKSSSPAEFVSLEDTIRNAQ